MVLLKKEETICLELGNKDSLQRSYGNQVSILQAWGRAGGGHGAAQETGSALPGAGQPERAGLLLLVQLANEQSQDYRLRFTETLLANH